jgi:hypothetical protein
MDSHEQLRSAQRALLTRAADCEASRLQAIRDRDWPRQATLERELAALWRAYADLDERAA